MYIVTGGAGFIGSAMLAKLNSQGIHDVLVVDNINTTAKWKNLVCKGFTDYLHKSKFLEQLESGKLGKIEGIFHLGACSTTTEKDMDYLMENNVKFTCRLADWCIANHVRLVYASSAATYGDGEVGYADSDELMPKLRPMNQYGYSKQLVDLWALRSGAINKVAGLKFFNVYGPNEYHKADMVSVVFKAFGWIKEKGKVTLFKSYNPKYRDGEQMRDFIYVKDCVEVMWWLYNNPKVNGVFNVGTGNARTWVDLAKGLYSAMNLDPKIEFIDMPENLKKQYQYFTEATMDKLRMAGYSAKFTSLEDGIQDYVKNYLSKDNPFL